MGIHLETCGFQAMLDHAKPAIRHDCSPEWPVGLKPNDDLLLVAVEGLPYAEVARGSRSVR